MPKRKARSAISKRRWQLQAAKAQFSEVFRRMSLSVPCGKVKYEVAAGGFGFVPIRIGTGLAALTWIAASAALGAPPKVILLD